jgi:hypothetical protein
MSVVQRGVRSRELPPPQPETAWVMSHPLMAYNESEDQPAELIEATENDRSTGIGDQSASAWEPSSYGGLQEIASAVLLESLNRLKT